MGIVDGRIDSMATAGEGGSTEFQLGNKEHTGRRERGCSRKHAIGARDYSMLALHDVEAAVLDLEASRRSFNQDMGIGSNILLVSCSTETTARKTIALL